MMVKVCRCYFQMDSSVNLDHPGYLRHIFGRRTYQSKERGAERLPFALAHIAGVTIINGNSQVLLLREGV